MRIILIVKILLCGIIFSGTNQMLYGQTKIAISIDDIPNTRKFESDNYRSILLDKLDSINIPISIFVNEGLIYKTDSIVENFKLLDDWIKRNYTTLGNHTFSHLRYSEVGYNKFEEDFEKGEHLLKELAIKYEKPLRHFRFPYNDLGKDSAEHHMIDSLLQSRNYISTPFTVESSDWMFNYIYEYYISQSNLEKAEEIGRLYVSATIDYIHFFDSLSIVKHDRKISQIYLCHDNSLNAVYLSRIIELLAEENFNFVSIDEALKDSVYLQEFEYHRKWGVSWMYRWMPTQTERVKWMRQEPDISYIELLFNELSDKK